MNLLGKNVRELYKIGMEHLQSMGEIENSRNGRVIVSPIPVMSIYEFPTQRVLVNKTRDCNPFFHFFESLWMLSGSQNGLFLDQYVSDFTSRFSDTGEDIHGAYGYRWRHHFGLDQIRSLIYKLKENLRDRRTVLTMWDPDADFSFNSKDIPCNVNIFFRINKNKLDMMVNCRSNDIIWGCYGANAVHMSMLQEFISSSLEIEMGYYYQNSFNYHAYTDLFYKLIPTIQEDIDWCSPYEKDLVKLVSNPNTFLNECEKWCIDWKAEWTEPDFQNTVFPLVAIPMKEAHRFYKQKKFEQAIKYCSYIAAEDWRRACTEWLERRQSVHETRKDAGEVSYESA